MNPSEIRTSLKELMIKELNLAGKKPEDIQDAAPLFGEGLGLDSLDALQLAMCVEEHFGVRVPEGPEARTIFASVDALADHILAHRNASDAGASGGGATGGPASDGGSKPAQSGGGAPA